MRLTLMALLSVSLVWGCAKKEDDPKPSDRVTAAQLQQLEAMSDAIRGWAHKCGAYGIACMDDSDGDSMLWAGLLCASGEEDQCEAALASIAPNGRPGRSFENLTVRVENSFSRDMLLGALLAIAKTKNQEKAESLLDYITSHGNKLCTDATDNRCDLNPAVYSSVWGTMRKVWDHIGLEPTLTMKHADVADDTIASIQAQFSPPGYGMHLPAVTMYMRRFVIGQWTSQLQAGANSLRRDVPQNAFFEFVAKGKTKRAAALTLKYAPTEEPRHADQWTWSSDWNNEDWLRSNGWDFIFMANVLR